MSAATLAWGTPVMVSHQAARIVGRHHDITEPDGTTNGSGFHRMKTVATVGTYHVACLNTERGRYISPPGMDHDPTGEWPGVPIDIDAVAPRWPNYVPEPTWPGMPDGPHLPENQAQQTARSSVWVRVRRFPFDEPRAGVVLGRRRRVEGRRHPARGYMDDFDQGFLSAQRTLELYEVALAPQTDTTQPLPGHIVMAWVDDITPDPA